MLGKMSWLKMVLGKGARNADGGRGWLPLATAGGLCDENWVVVGWVDNDGSGVGYLFFFLFFKNNNGLNY